MEKLIIIPEGQLTTVLESYDNLIEEFAKGRWQFIELKRMSNMNEGAVLENLKEIKEKIV